MVCTNLLATRRDFLRAALAGALAAPARAGVQPNIVLFITDSQRHDSVGCYGNRLVRTPNLNRLASTGARFDAAYCAAPLCSPSRASIFSGVYPHRHGVVDLWGKVPSPLGPVPGWPNPSRTDLPWLGELFSAARYDTAYVGKWHCLTGGQRPGFKRILSRYGDSDDWDSREQNDHAAYARSKGYTLGERHGKDFYKPKGRNYGTSLLGVEDHGDTYLVRKAQDFLREPHSRPFFLVIGVISPHAPYAPPSPFDAMYSAAAVTLPPNVHVYANQRRPIGLRLHPTDRMWIQHASEQELRARYAHYYGMVTHLDQLVGDLMSTLERQSLRERTLFLYTSDHGDAMGSHRVEDKGAFMYDTVTRVPLIISYPAAVRPQVISEPVSLVDVLPTLLDLAGIRDPVRRDGRSWAPVLTQGGALASGPVFCEYNRFYGEDFPVRAIITSRHKYVHYFGPDGELFDRLQDPHEITNRLHDPGYSQTRADLQSQLFKHLRRSDDPFFTLLSDEQKAMAAP